jgi:hypothetical protein
MINVGKKLPDIALQNPASAGIVPTGGVSEFTEPSQGPMRALAQPAGIRIGDESPIKERIQNPINRMMD